jgi:phosphoribosyl-AMP cyclohydrolase
MSEPTPSASEAAALPDLSGLKYDDRGLVPAVIQDFKDGQVLMVAYMDQEALRRTLAGGRTCFYSRSRKEYWVKGMSSGNTQKVLKVLVDCDLDCLLIVVRQEGQGVACHTGKRSCFFRRLQAGSSAIVELDVDAPVYLP